MDSLASSERFVYSTEFWEIIIATDQTYLGRCVVLLKRDCGDLAEVNREEFTDLLENVIQKLEKACTEAFGAKMFNWACLMNNAYQEPDPKPQVHWHFRPRYDHPVEFAGETFEDPNFGHHYKRGDDFNREVSPAVQRKIIEEIRKFI